MLFLFFFLTNLKIGIINFYGFIFFYNFRISGYKINIIYIVCASDKSDDTAKFSKKQNPTENSSYTICHTEIFLNHRHRLL